jgi:sulfate adenylyltransferase (ADP) / ATP adenylyltransferase
MSEIIQNKDVKILLEPGTLVHGVKNTTDKALACGALLSIPTESQIVEQDGVKFLVRILSNLVRKDEAKNKQDKQTAITGKDFNPFLPYEQNLWVADILNTHVCILNKFNVVDHHLLIITRDFESQESLLTPHDFTAMWACLNDIDGLVFYNAGKIAGASQKHKHLQLVPLPLASICNYIPIEPLIAQAQFHDSIGTIPRLPFLHAFAKLNRDWINTPIEAGIATWQIYQKLLKAVKLEPGSNAITPTIAYNLLATRDWLMVVPRLHEVFDGISINSLGFAGALLVRNQEQMQQLKEYGPMTILKSVAVPL